jgi:tRNA modification GTPase
MALKNELSVSGLRQPIIAHASAVGKAGVGVVRISGQDLRPLLSTLTSINLVPRQAHLYRLRNAQSEDIDQGILFFYPGPHSFTGEDVLEFQGHGGVMLMNLVLERFLELGKIIDLRIAHPGEFSERAFLNNKIDLAQAEAIADLIEANSVAAIRSANRSLAGVFSEKIHHLVGALTDLRILVEATLDFPEEEIEFLENARAKDKWESIHQELLDLLHASEQGAILRQGANLVLAGLPNVGKSSLLNQFAGQELAIVTPIAGTTRDRIKEHLFLDGFPLQVMDTAGLRESSDTIERLGIERSWQAITQADLILYIRDANEPNSKESDHLLSEIHTLIKENNKSTRLIEVWNKADQLPDQPKEQRLLISAKTGLGIGALKAKILAALGWESQTEDTILARQRHLDALRQALVHVLQAQVYLVQGNQTLELFAEELRLAQEKLGQITGQLLPDDLLGKIFGSFCIGK